MTGTDKFALPGAKVNVPLLDLRAQHAAIREAVLPAVTAVIERQQFIMGPEVAALEEAIARLSRVRHAIGCASGTDALLLPLKALDLEPGDEVIVPPFTFFATAGTVHNAGGKPVFADIEPDSFNLSPAAVEAAITPRTRAIIAVHLYGQMARMEAILPIAAKRGIPVIEDAAQAIGARRKLEGAWRLAGETGWAGTLSFFPSKNLGAWGDGGMILTQDDALAERMRRLRLHGGTRQYHHDEVGTNSRLDTLQAAVLLAKLPFLEGWSAARREKAAAYSAAFERSGSIVPPAVDPANQHIFHQYTVRVPRRDALLDHLRTRGIGCAVYYPLALHLQPCFSHLGYRPGSLPAAEAATAEVVSLPVYPELREDQQAEVVRAVTEFYD
ncbi:MAG TPA: DegT/DnrJ/EryC1/StrS family aminotransferase [Gemmatimonadales bacterium]|jgi:dTDP-4-amino-4,6-dideoxygalactose transaminase|nr:DegT/DnrJ/EryC1/StrS family aminotransferase [Gemmatimonadales bacterium]